MTGRATLPSARPAGRGGGVAPAARPPWWRTRRVLVLAVAAAVVLGTGAWVVGWTSLLGVRAVAVTGVRTLSAADVRSAAAVPAGQPLARVDTAAVARRVGAIPGVARVAVTRSWPSTLRIAVTERQGVAVIVRDGTPWLVDGSGVVFQRLDGPPNGLPRLDVADAGPDDPATRAALSALQALTAPVRAQLRVVAAATAEALRLDLSGGRTVIWGDAENAAAKAQALQALLSRPGRTYDVSTPAVVTVRP